MKTAIRKVRNTLAGLLVLAMLAGVSGSVYAENTGVLDSVAAGTTLDINAGQVNENFGIIATNGRTDSGPAVVVTNGETGTVKRNDGVILTNQGTVGVDKNEMPPATDNSGPPSVGNFGTIEVNEGTVHFNKGNIGKRDENGDPIESQGNFGYVQINGGGTVTFNYENAVIADNHGHVSVNMGTVGENYRTINRNYNEVGLNGQEIFDDGGANIGVVETNYGKVRKNESEITTNARTDSGPAVVITNGETGTVKRNDGVIVTNQGTVGVDKNEMPPATDNSGPPSVGNFGTIEVNEGTVHFNKGNIGKRDENGDPIESQGNFGYVQINGGGTVSINHDGATIDNNHGTVVVNNGTVKENYRIIETNNSEVTLNGQETFEDGENLGVIRENNETVVTNQGRIVDNKGDVTVNEGLIHTNNGKVSENNIDTFIFLDNGQKVTAPGVEVNNGTVESSKGSVDTNMGFIGALDENGMMKSGNTGRIRVNGENGIVLNLAGGIIYTNNGTVYNFGGTIEKRGTGTEFFSVEIVNNTENTSVSTNGLQEAYGRQWLGQTGTMTSTATIRLIPKDGYEIVDVTGLADNVTAVKNDDGTWTLTISSGKNTEIDVPESTEKTEASDAPEDPPVANEPEDLSIPGESGNGVHNVNNWYEYAETLPQSNPERSNIPAAANVPDAPAAVYAPVYTETVIAVTAADTAGNVETVAYTIETDPPAPQAAEAAVTVSATESGTETVISKDVEEVLTQGTENTAFEDAVNPEKEAYNEEFAAAAQSALTIGAGTVDFGGAFAGAEETTVDVSVAVADAQAGQEYTVVLSNGDTITVKCEKDGELVIPFPKDAENLSFVVQSDYASRYAKLIENYLLYGEQALEGRSAKTQAFVKAYAEELSRNS